MILPPMHIKAALSAMSGSAILGFIDNFVGPISQEAGLWQFHMMRSLIALPVIFVWAWVLGISLWPKNFRATLLRSLAVTSGLLIYFGALGLVSVAQAGAGIFSAPIWVLIFTALLFRQKIHIRQILAIGVGFGGVLMLLQPDWASFSTLSFLPLLSGAFYGLGMMATRHWCSQETALSLVTGVLVLFGMAGAVMLAVLAWVPVPDGLNSFLVQGWVTPSRSFLWLTLLQALGSIVAVALLTQAYKIGDPPNVSVFEYSFLIFAAIWSYFLWEQTTNMQALVGIAFIIVSGLTIALTGKRHLP